jgi:hypothetical protein
MCCVSISSIEVVEVRSGADDLQGWRTFAWTEKKNRRLQVVQRKALDEVVDAHERERPVMRRN